MAKHSKRSASIFRYPVLIAFSLFFVGLFALDLVTPDRAYSELENTTLSQRPSLSSFSADGLNKFFTAYTKYVKDQVAGRDSWVALQSTVETKVMQKEQKMGNLQRNLSYQLLKLYYMRYAQLIHILFDLHLILCHMCTLIVGKEHLKPYKYFLMLYDLGFFHLFLYELSDQC